MNKLIVGLFLSLFLLMAPTTSVAATDCAFIAKLHYSIALQRDRGVHPLQLVETGWAKVDDKTITMEQLAHILSWVIKIYSTDATAEDIKTAVFDQCMKAEGKTQL